MDKYPLKPNLRFKGNIRYTIRITEFNTNFGIIINRWQPRYYLGCEHSEMGVFLCQFYSSHPFEANSSHHARLVSYSNFYKLY